MKLSQKVLAEISNCWEHSLGVWSRTTWAPPHVPQLLSQTAWGSGVLCVGQMGQKGQIEGFCVGQKGQIERSWVGQERQIEGF